MKKKKINRAYLFWLGMSLNGFLSAITFQFILDKLKGQPSYTLLQERRASQEPSLIARDWVVANELLELVQEVPEERHESCFVALFTRSFGFATWQHCKRELGMQAQELYSVLCEDNDLQIE